jgi:hypothetical protein
MALLSANGVITGMRPTPVRPTDITAHRGLTAASLSEPVPGSAGATAIAGTATVLVIAGAMDVAMVAMPEAVVLDLPAAVASLAAVGSMETREVAAAGSTAAVAAGSTAVVVDMVAAVTGSPSARG